jgi:hypothetical protein
MKLLTPRDTTKINAWHKSFWKGSNVPNPTLTLNVYQPMYVRPAPTFLTFRELLKLSIR